MKDEMRKALVDLRSQGVTHVNVEFSGEGDDGCIQEVNLMKNGAPVDVEHGAFQEAAYGYLDDNVAIDWVNNEGGGGSLRIDLTGEKFKVKLDAYSNVNTTVDEPTHTEEV